MTMDLTLAICMYNAEKYIIETLDCIIKQTFQDFNLLIVDDCCTDLSVSLVENFFKHHPRQYEIVHIKPNKGLCAGRLFVEKNVSTKYILFVDSDDLPCPTLVEKLYNKISSDEDLMAVGCYLDFIDSNGKKLNGGIYLGDTTKESFYKRAQNGKLIFMQPTAIYDRELALSVGGHNVEGFPEGKPRYADLCEDLDLWTRMSDLYVDRKAIVVIPEVLCHYRKHQKAMSSNSLGMILRMKHIKRNVKARRNGGQDISFVQFLDNISKTDMRKLKQEAEAADAFRSAYYDLKALHIFTGMKLLCCAVVKNPKYVYNKITKNLLHI